MSYDVHRNIMMYDQDGNRLACYLCGHPATGVINVSVACASSVPSIFKPVCDHHNPYRFTIVHVRQQK